MTDFILILPEIFLALTLVFVIIGEMTYHGERSRLTYATALMGLGAAFIQTLLTYQQGVGTAFSRTISIDGLSLFLKLLFISLAILAIWVSARAKEIPEHRKSEYCALILASALAMCFTASATDLLFAYLSLQMLGILCFFLAGYNKRSVLSTEAAVKYMTLNVVSGAILLYGLAILFAVTHSLNIYEIHKAVATAMPSRAMMGIVFILLFLGLAFQLGVFPLYLWAPDVIEGAPTPASGFLSVAPRFAGIGVMIRLLIATFAAPGSAPGEWAVLGDVDWTAMVALVSGLTMLIGALLAFRQNGAKRLVACLVVSNTGALLMGLLVLDEIGIAAILYNLLIEMFSLLGIFFILSYFLDELRSDRLEDLKGILGYAVPESICLVIFLTCLVGIPPTPGFIGKFTLVGAVIRHHWYGLGTVSIVSSAICAAAVSRLCFSLVGELPGPHGLRLSPHPHRKLFLTAISVPLLLSGVFAQLLLDWAGKSLSFIFW